MSTSDHSNGLFANIEFMCNREKKTNSSATTIFLFVFLSKPNINMVTPPMIYIPHTHLEVYTVPFGCCIAGVTILMLVLLRKTKWKMMVAEAFVLFSDNSVR